MNIANTVSVGIIAIALLAIVYSVSSHYESQEAANNAGSQEVVSSVESPRIAGDQDIKGNLDLELRSLLNDYHEVVLQRNRYKDQHDQLMSQYLDLVTLFESTTGNRCPEILVETSQRQGGLASSYSIRPVC